MDQVCPGKYSFAIGCPQAVFEVLKGKASINDINDCMECGACARNCRFGAITVKSGVGCAAGIINGILNQTQPTICELGKIA